MTEPAADLVITGPHTQLDVPAVVAAMGERMPALLDRSHGRRIQDYDT